MLASSQLVSAQAPATYTASADFSNVQGYRNWYYLDSTGAQMYYNGSAWQGPETYLLLWSNGGHPGNFNDAVRQWRAPSTGSVHITGNASDANVSCGSGVIVSIKNGNQVLWQRTIENGDTVGFTYDLAINVNAGDQLNFVINNRGDWNCDSTNFDPTIVLTPIADGVLASSRNTPFTGTRISLPGTIETENFDNGGADIGFHDTSAGSHGQDYDNPPNYPPPAYRQPTDVDIYKSAGGYSNGYLVVMQAGDWMNYSVAVGQEGTYTIDARVAWGGGAGGNFHIDVDGLDVTGPIQIPDTNWGLTTVTKSGIQLPSGNHTMRVVADTNGVYNCTGDIDYFRFTSENLSYVITGTPTTIPVHIEFDQLAGVPIPNGTIIDNQWLQYAGVKFYSGNGFFPVHIYQTCGPCSTTSPPNYINTKPDDSGILNVEFTQPVSNLSFFIVGVDAFFNNPFAVLDVYRGGSFFGSFVLQGNSTYTVWVNLGTLDNISKIVVRNINDTLGVGFYDFVFNVPADVKITSGRVSGYLNGTTQSALLGADVALNASMLLGAFDGGRYSWSCAPVGQCSVVSGSNSSAVTFRFNEVGTFTATVTYTNMGVQTSASVSINSVLPTLTSFTGQETADMITKGGTPAAPNRCGDVLPFWRYRIGCGAQQEGMAFDSRVQGPTTFISDPQKAE